MHSDELKEVTIMKNKLFLVLILAVVVSMTSCEKACVPPFAEAGVENTHQTRGGENGESGEGDTSGETITDTGHDSDYDKNTNKKRKATTPGN